MLDDLTHWRDSARTPKLYFLDAYACFPMVIFLVHIQWWTFYAAVMSTIFFSILHYVGFSLPVFLRYLRSTLAGSHRPAAPWWLTRIKE